MAARFLFPFSFSLLLPSFLLLFPLILNPFAKSVLTVFRLLLLFSLPPDRNAFSLFLLLFSIPRFLFSLSLTLSLSLSLLASPISFSVYIFIRTPFVPLPLTFVSTRYNNICHPSFQRTRTLSHLTHPFRSILPFPYTRSLYQCAPVRISIRGKEEQRILIVGGEEGYEKKEKEMWRSKDDVQELLTDAVRSVTLAHRSHSRSLTVSVDERNEINDDGRRYES